MKYSFLAFFMLLSVACSTNNDEDSDNIAIGHSNPVVTSWLQNTMTTSAYYTAGNSTLTDTGLPANCQLVEFSDDYVYIHTHGLPTYPFGPFGFVNDLDEKDVIYQFPLNPTENTGMRTETRPGNIGILINGTSLFDFRDDVAWNNETGTLCGGPLNSDCPGGRGATQDWNRDAVLAEKSQFDCAKGHGGVSTFHHHQNPTAYKLDKSVISDICSLYDSDALYQLDESAHSPLIGFAYDGFPIYGAYGYKNLDGSGGITRMLSGYHLRDITTRENGPDVGLVVTYTAGPPQNPDTFNDTLSLGYFREDYEYIASSEPDVLDEHNGRFCVTPDYPEGTYAYFVTVDENWNSIYPYAVGPTFYGVTEVTEVSSVTEETTVYSNSSIGMNADENPNSFNVIVSPFADLLAIQINSLVKKNIDIKLKDVDGNSIQNKQILAGSTIAYFDTQTLYEGTYSVELSNENFKASKEVFIGVQ